MRENYLPLNGYENSRLQSGKDGWFGMALVGKWGRRHTHTKERGVYYQKYFPTASSYIIPIFERRGEIRSPKRKFQNGRKQNKCVEKFVCVIHRKREWGYFIIIILYFFSCYDREKRLDVWGNFRGRLAHAKTHFIPVFLLHFLHLSTYFSFVCFLDSADLDFWLLGWGGAHIHDWPSCPAVRNRFFTLFAAGSCCSFLFSFFVLNILPSFSWALSFLFF